MAPEPWLPVDEGPIPDSALQSTGIDFVGPGPAADALLPLEEQPAYMLTPEEQQRRAEHLALVQAQSDAALASRKRKWP